MPCPDCTAASAGPHHGFTHNCPGCMARSLARSPAFFHSRKDGMQTKPYRRALRECGLTHDVVVAAHEADAMSAAAAQRESEQAK